MHANRGRSEKSMSGAQTVTIDVELIDLGPDRHLLRLPTLEQVLLDGLDHAGQSGIKLDREVRAIHLEGFTIGFIIHVLISAAERRWIACYGQLI